MNLDNIDIDLFMYITVGLVLVALAYQISRLHLRVESLYTNHKSLSTKVYQKEEVNG